MTSRGCRSYWSTGYVQRGGGGGGGGGEVSNTYVGAFYLVTECTIEIIIFGMNCSLIQGIYQITYNDVLLSK